MHPEKPASFPARLAQPHPDSRAGGSPAHHPNCRAYLLGISLGSPAPPRPVSDESGSVFPRMGANLAHPPRADKRKFCSFFLKPQNMQSSFQNSYKMLWASSRHVSLPPPPFCFIIKAPFGDFPIKSSTQHTVVKKITENLKDGKDGEGRKRRLRSAPRHQPHSLHALGEASLGIRQSPRGEREIVPTLGPSGIQLRLYCCAKKRCRKVFSARWMVSSS